MSLQEKLNAMKARFESRTPPYDKVSQETIDVMHRATEDLRNSGILDGTLKVGDQAPDFTLPNPEGKNVSSEDLLARGFLVLSFYRGVW
jgi:hypothetical protein